MKYKNKKNKGFTLVELMAGVIMSAILAITIGMMLYFSYSNWRTNSEAIELQRDATIAMEMISRAIRPAATIAIPDTVHGAGDYSIEITDATGNAVSFYLVDDGGLGTLFYDPDGGTHNEDECIVIVDNKIDDLSFANHATIPNTIVIKMVLQNNATSTTVDSAISFRNAP